MGEYLFLCNNNDEEAMDKIFESLKEYYENHCEPINKTEVHEDGVFCIEQIICGDLAYMILEDCDNCYHRHRTFCELNTVRAIIKDYCRDHCTDVYFYNKEMRPMLQENFEAFCKRLKCDVSKVQPAYDKLMDCIKEFEYVDKDQNEDDCWFLFDKYMRQKNVVETYDELLDSFVRNSEWKHMFSLVYYGWDTDIYYDFDECGADKLLHQFSKNEWKGDFDLIEIRTFGDDDE